MSCLSCHGHGPAVSQKVSQSQAPEPACKALRLWIDKLSACRQCAHSPLPAPSAQHAVRDLPVTLVLQDEARRKESYPDQLAPVRLKSLIVSIVSSCNVLRLLPGYPSSRLPRYLSVKACCAGDQGCLCGCWLCSLPQHHWRRRGAVLRLGEEQRKAAAQQLFPSCPSLAGPKVSCSKVFTTFAPLSCRSNAAISGLPSSPPLCLRQAGIRPLWGSVCNPSM